jgi:adenylate cyclase
MALAEAGTDASVQITLKAILCHALRTSGRMSEALQMNTEAMDRAHEIAKFDRQTLGFDIEVWLWAMRGQTLAVLGRTDEARPFLDRVLQLDEGHVDAIHHVIPSLAYVDIAWAEGNPVLAQAHAERAFSLAVKSGNPYLRVYAQACRGLALTIAGQLGSAIDDLSSALRFARSRKAGLENEARILADLANAYRLNGDVASALTTVDEAIRVATARHARFPECLARIVRANILSESKAGDQIAAASEERNRAETLMRETGALIFEKFITGAPTDAKTAMPRQIPPIAG